MYTHMYTYMSVCVYTYIWISTRTMISVYICTYFLTHTCIYITDTYAYTCIYTHTYVHKKKEEIRLDCDCRIVHSQRKLLKRGGISGHGIVKYRGLELHQPPGPDKCMCTSTCVGYDCYWLEMMKNENVKEP